MDVLVRLPHPRSGGCQGQETFLAPFLYKQTCNYDIECSNHHPLLSTLRLKGLSRSKMKYWAIHTNLPGDVIVRIPHSWSGDSQGQERFLPPSAEKQTRNYDIECSNHHPLLSNVRLKGLSRSKMKRWTIHTNVPADVIVRLPHPQSGDSQGQETFLAPSADKKIRNYDIEGSNHHLLLSTLRPTELTSSKMKWWAIHTNLPVDVIVRLPHPRWGDIQCQKTSFAPPADKKTRNYDIECWNQHRSLSPLRPMGLSSSKMNSWAIHTNLQVDVIVGLHYPRRGDSRNRETFEAPSPAQPTCNDGIECSNHNPSLSTLMPKGLSHSKMKWWAAHTNLPVDFIVILPHPRMEIERARKRF